MVGSGELRAISRKLSLSKLSGLLIDSSYYAVRYGFAYYNDYWGKMTSIAGAFCFLRLIIQFFQPTEQVIKPVVDGLDFGAAGQMGF